MSLLSRLPNLIYWLTQIFSLKFRVNLSVNRIADGSKIQQIGWLSGSSQLTQLTYTLTPAPASSPATKGFLELLPAMYLLNFIVTIRIQPLLTKLPMKCYYLKTAIVLVCLYLCPCCIDCACATFCLGCLALLFPTLSCTVLVSTVLWCPPGYHHIKMANPALGTQDVRLYIVWIVL